MLKYGTSVFKKYACGDMSQVREVENVYMAYNLTYFCHQPTKSDKNVCEFDKILTEKIFAVFLDTV